MRHEKAKKGSLTGPALPQKDHTSPVTGGGEPGAPQVRMYALCHDQKACNAPPRGKGETSRRNGLGIDRSRRRIAVKVLPNYLLLII